MPRSKTPAVHTDPLPDTSADHTKHGELVAHRAATLEHIDKRYGFDFGYDRQRLIDVGREAAFSIAERYYVIGRVCLLLKEHEPQGTFGSALEEMGIQQDFAHRAMTIARKYQGDGTRKELVDRLSVRKLLELAHEPDEALDDLAERGVIAGLTLDEVDKMSVRELRAALRKERSDKTEELAARDEIIARKDEKLHKLELKNRGLTRKPANERALELLTELDVAVTTMLAAGDEVKSFIESIAQVYAEAGEDCDAAIEARLRHAAEAAAALTDGIEKLLNG
jgi:hypothetical protein